LRVGRNTVRRTLLVDEPIWAGLNRDAKPDLPSESLRLKGAGVSCGTLRLNIGGRLGPFPLQAEIKPERLREHSTVDADFVCVA